MPQLLSVESKRQPDYLLSEPKSHNDKHISLRFSCVYGHISAEVVVFTLQSLSNTGSGTEVFNASKIMYPKYTYIPTLEKPRRL